MKHASLRAPIRPIQPLQMVVERQVTLEKVRLSLSSMRMLSSFISQPIGCSMSEADRYRRGFKNMKKGIIEEFKKKVNNPSIIKELSHLRKYSFAKGHSIAYGQNGVAAAYHKARRPKEFWESTLRHNQSSYKKWVHKREAINNGVWIRNSIRGNVYDQFTKSVGGTQMPFLIIWVWREIKIQYGN